MNLRRGQSAILARDTLAGGVTVLRVTVTEHYVEFEARDGSTNRVTLATHKTTDNLLYRYRPATDAETNSFLASTTAHRRH